MGFGNILLKYQFDEFLALVLYRPYLLDLTLDLIIFLQSVAMC